MIKLYQGRSLIQLNKKYKIQCYWFCVNRYKPFAPYAELIKDYDPRKNGIKVAQRGVDSFFTEQEIEMLDHYLNTRKMDLEVEEFKNLPVESNFVGIIDAPLGGGAKELILSEEEEDYSLPFEVWGYYDCKDQEDLVESPAYI